MSPAEWDVMRVIWSNDGVTSKEIIQCLQAKFDWKPTTIKTLLRRLIDKKMVRIEKYSKYYVYYPIASEQEYSIEAMKDVMDKVCNLQKVKVLAKLVQGIDLTKQDQQYLLNIINQHETVDKVQCCCAKNNK